ncbi:MAG: DUF4160 domain-containing protein [Novosphingobium sp.]
MVTLHRGPNWKVSVYGREHGVPHFHVEGPGIRCSVAIATLEVIVGAVPSAVFREPVDWALGHRSELLATWQELNR